MKKICWIFNIILINFMGKCLEIFKKYSFTIDKHVENIL